MTPSERDNDAERLARIEHMVEKLRAAATHLAAVARFAQETAVRIEVHATTDRNKKGSKKRSQKRGRKR